MIRHVIWDWNGTLLDDVDACVSTLNGLLRERGMPAVTRDAYREAFGFPVRDYYVGLGFNFEREDFAALSVDFIARYRALCAEVALHDPVSATLAAVAERGASQRIVSAMEQELLLSMVREFGVHEFLVASHGIGDLQATSKVELGVRVVRELGGDPAEILLVGDTIHDHELAEAAGCRCVLFAGGHQSPARLRATGRPVIERLDDVAHHLAD